MSKEVQRLDVIFKDPAAIFRPTDIVSGVVQIELIQELKLKGMKLYLLGAARVHWDEKRAYTKGSSAKLSHRNLDSYLDETCCILDQSDTLAPGRYSWPFSVRLPPHLPASYEGQWGRVQYVTKLVVERPWKGDIEVARAFTVIGVLDLNAEPDARRSTENAAETMLGAGCCKSGPLTGHLALTRRGFAVGQTIPFRASVENGTSRGVNVRLVLSQQATFRADKQLRKNSTLVTVLTKGEVGAGQDLVWEDALGALPPLPPTGLGGGCRTIDIRYTLTLVVVPSGSGRDLEVAVEVIIGSVPIRRGEVLESTSSSSSGRGQQGDLGTGRSARTGQQRMSTTSVK